MDPANRPLSPHLQIYRPQITSVLSILHRLSGVGLGVGTLLLTYWLISVAAGPGPFDFAQGLIRSWVGIVLLIGWTFGLLFHFCNGIRHLFWDAGYGYELDTVYRSGWVVVLTSVLLTAGIWLALVMAGGI